MSEDEIKGKATKLKGKVREEIGEATGNTKEQIKGKAEQAKGEMQETTGKVKKKLT
jgi:uncharacterized protein YjbJ (UPF0337 family)